MNLSQQKRERMLTFLNTLKETNKGNLEVLKSINEIETELTSKKYGLIWEEHEEQVDIDMQTKIPVFTEVKDKEIKKNDGEYNFLLEGDNLHSLYLLEKTHKGKIDVIYIDPPYNTGSEDFKYDDKFVNFDDGFRHSKWCSFMYARLYLARKLLSEKGFIAISIDDNEYPVLKMLCDDIFGEKNYMSTFHIQVRYPEKSINEEKKFKPLMEYILLYSKNNIKLDIKQEETEYGLEKFCFKITETGDGEKFSVGKQDVIVFKPNEWKMEKIDGNIEGLKETWITGSIYTTMSYGKVFQKVVEPRVDIDGLGCLYKVLGRGEDGLGYRYYTGPQRATAKKGKMYSGVPLERVEEFKLGNIPKRKQPILTVFDFAADFGNIRHEGGIPFGSGKKPIKMIKQLINYSNNKNAIVLDFFAGSGSTGESVIELNKEDSGNRKYILCTNNENNICENITYPRLKTTITGIRIDGTKYSEGCDENLKYYNTDFIDKSSSNLDIELNKHTKELVQLENAVDIDDKNVLLAFDNDELSNLLENVGDNKIKKLYISRYVMLNTKQKQKLKNVPIEVIPDYYFKKELKEKGLNWR